MKYEVQLHVRRFGYWPKTIEADSPEEAFRIAKSHYDNDDVIVDDIHHYDSEIVQIEVYSDSEFVPFLPDGTRRTVRTAFTSAGA